MEAHELLEKARKNEVSYQEIVEWCGENASNLDLGNLEQRTLFELSTKYLMKSKMGNWNDKDASMIIKYFAKVYAEALQIENDVSIDVVSNSEYIKEIGHESNAICIADKDGKSKLVYSSNVIDNLKSEDTLKFLRGLQTVFHEVVHAKQYNNLYKKDDNIEYNGRTYKMALETMIRKADSQFYQKNYSDLIMEYDAEYRGIKCAATMMNRYYKENFVKKEDIEELANVMMEMNGKNSYENLEKVKFGERELNSKALLSYAADVYAQKMPEIIQEIPILKFAYNDNGSKKDIMQLLQDREKLINEKTDLNLQSVNDLYKTIANYRTINGKEEVSQIFDYITDNKIEDEFAYDLLQYRLEKYSTMNQDGIADYIQGLKQNVSESKIMDEQEKELQKEQEKGIKDEIGDEFKPKTDEDMQKEEQIEAKWRNNFQAWDRNALKLPNAAKRKEEAVKVMKEVERERNQEEKQKEQENEEMMNRS